MDKKIVILPTYNESENIQKLIEEILNLNIDGLYILVVDDGSPDGTGRLVSSIMKKNPKVSLIEKDKKSGLGPAYVTGFKFALENGYSFIITMDADFSHDFRKIPQFLEVMKETDLVLGSRYIKGGGVRNCSLYRRFLSRAANLVAKVAVGGGFRDYTDAFRCYKRKVIESFDLDTIFSKGYSCLVEFLFKAKQKGFRIKEIPMIFTNRKYGQSKIAKEEIFLGLLSLVRIAWMKALNRDR